MFHRHWTVVSAAALLIAAGAVLAADAPTPKPADKDATYHGVFKFASLKQGNGQMTVSASRVQGGNAVDMLITAKDAGGIDLESLKFARGGELLEITCTNTAKPTITSLGRYDVKWGEDEPGIFVFSAKSTTKVGAAEYTSITVTKFLEPFTILVPNKKGADGKLAPDAALVKAIDALKAGDLAEVAAETVDGRLTLKSIDFFEPYRKAEFLRVVKGKPDKDELTGIEVKTGEGEGAVSRYYLDPKSEDFADLTKAIGAFRLGDNVLIRTITTNKIDWLLGIRTTAVSAQTQSGPDRLLPANWPRRGLGRGGRMR